MLTPVRSIDTFVLLGKSLMNSLNFQSSYRGSCGSAVSNGRNLDCHKTPRARKLRPEEQNFLYLTALWGSNEGGIGHVSLGVNFGLSEETVTNYIHHVSIKVHRVLKEFNRIVWPTEEGRAAKRGLLIGFPEFIGFVDGNRTRRWRPKDTIRQELAFDGHRHAHVFSILQ
jgi:hypothetical protein